MKRTRYTEEQIIGILKEQESGLPVAGICRRHVLDKVFFINGDLNMMGWKLLMFAA